jgi:hypothetical protein
MSAPMSAPMNKGEKRNFNLFANHHFQAFFPTNVSRKQQQQQQQTNKCCRFSISAFQQKKLS